jgi:hypothetical protein
MAKGINLRIEGITALKKSFKKRTDKMNDLIDAELDAFSLEVNAAQKSRTPIDNGVLVKGNNINISKPLYKEIFNNIKYAPYIEFGTGGYVKVPKGLEDIAIQFKGAGKKVVNIQPHPFFFPPFFEQKKELIKQLKKIVTS